MNAEPSPTVLRFPSAPAGVRPPDRDSLRAHLVGARIAGDIATPRQSNLANIRLMSSRDPGYLFGIRPRRPWSPDDVLGLMAERCGISPDPDHTEGSDTIDPDLTLDALDAMAARLALAVERRERVVVATGHPTGLLAVHVEVARALTAAGCTVATPGTGWSYQPPERPGARHRIRYVGGVAMVSDGANLRHTHAPEPMEALLDALRGTEAGLPDLVLADHGWAGAAGEAGVETVGFADSNDPALFVGEAEGRVAVCVPLDDNVEPHLYAPLTAYLLDRVGS